MDVPTTAENLVDMLEIRRLSVDDLSTARYVVGAAFARGAAGHYSPPEIGAFAEFVRSPHYADILLGNHAYGAFVGSEMVGIAAWSVGEDKKPCNLLIQARISPNGRP